jgi:hypothetical protein
VFSQQRAMPSQLAGAGSRAIAWSAASRSSAPRSDGTAQGLAYPRHTGSGTQWSGLSATEPTSANSTSAGRKQPGKNGNRAAKVGHGRPDIAQPERVKQSLPRGYSRTLAPPTLAGCTARRRATRRPGASVTPVEAVSSRSGTWSDAGIVTATHEPPLSPVVVRTYTGKSRAITRQFERESHRLFDQGYRVESQQLIPDTRPCRRPARAGCS